MSVALELAPCAPVPLPPAPVRRTPAQVITLHRPSERSVAPALRLTRRGVAVLTAAVALLSAAVVWLAWRSAPAVPAPAGRAPAAVTVHSGDTLWAIATRVAPERDPRAEVAELQRLNRLHGVQLVAGQVLRTR